MRNALKIGKRTKSKNRKNTCRTRTKTSLTLSLGVPSVFGGGRHMRSFASWLYTCSCVRRKKKTPLLTIDSIDSLQQRSQITWNESETFFCGILGM